MLPSATIYRVGFGRHSGTEHSTQHTTRQLLIWARVGQDRPWGCTNQDGSRCLAFLQGTEETTQVLRQQEAGSSSGHCVVAGEAVRWMCMPKSSRLKDSSAGRRQNHRHLGTCSTCNPPRGSVLHYRNLSGRYRRPRAPRRHHSGHLLGYLPTCLSHLPLTRTSCGWKQSGFQAPAVCLRTLTTSLPLCDHGCLTNGGILTHSSSPGRRIHGHTRTGEHFCLVIVILSPCRAFEHRD